MSGIVILLILLLSAVMLVFGKKLITDRCDVKRAGYIIIPCTDKTENLERLVKSYYWEEAFETSDYAREIVLVQLEKSKNEYTAKRLEQDYSIVTCVDISELADYIKRKEVKCYKNGF